MADYPGMLPPPPGVTPNMIDPESIGWKLLVAGVVCPVGALLFWLLRVYTARCILRKWHTDDWLITASLVLAIGLSAVDMSQTEYGMGIHMWDVTPPDFQHAIIVGIPASIFYNLSTLCVKASILFFYLRFAAANPPFRIAVYTVLFVVIVYSLNAGFSFLYLCNPIRRLWDGSDGTCVDLYTAFLVSSAINSATDVVILLLPMWLLWPLTMELRQKIAVGLVLMTGGFVCGVSFFRLATIPAGKDDPDVTWNYCINNIWCLVELYVGIVCACLPCLKPFVRKRLPSIFGISPAASSDDLSSPGPSVMRGQMRHMPVSDISLHDKSIYDHSSSGWSSSGGNTDMARTESVTSATTDEKKLPRDQISTV
ncbi:hypothetical protein B0H66DRAFT_540454 [Apodospora peruviana]|uniref:Rhodopsin domain-containing protein n=1 Tax=Apodospora peruviana TaxID=516989 RepID=A0AAE0IQJ8_9PEZI|nr:hypothetical protein B0H66DRAFT_540454 [Apodospora peruviana]